MSGVVLWVLTNTAFAAVLALAVLGIGRLLRPGPAVMHGLWLLVLLRLCWPPGVGIEVAMPIWSAGATPAERARPQLPELDAARLSQAPPAWLDELWRAPVVPPAAAPVGGAAAADVALTGASSAGRDGSAAAERDVVEPDVWSLAPPPAAGPGTPAPGLAASLGGLTRWLPWAWATGSGLVLLWALLGIRRGNRRFAHAPVASRRIVEEVADLARRMGMRGPAVVDDAAATTPFVWVFGRPRLVVCSRALARLEPTARHAVLAHELAHLRRGDAWWLRLELLLAAAWFWHPLFWLARRRLREQAELACDAWALWAEPAARHTYAAALIDALDQRDPAPALPVLAARPAARRAFERRLTMILHDKVPCRLSRWAMTGLLAVTLGLSVAPVGAQGREQERRQDPSAAAPRVEITVDGRRLEELSRREQRQVLQQLGLQGEALELVLRARQVGGGAGEEAGGRRSERRDDRRADEREEPRAEPRRTRQERLRERGDADQADEPRELTGVLRMALEEARREIRADEDLAELGITDDVLALVDTALSGRDFRGSLDKVIEQAIEGAGRMAMRELRADPDLQRLGIADDIGEFVIGLAKNKEVRHGLQALAGKALKSALGEARREVLDDEDLQGLGIAEDVANMLDGVAEGRLDLDALGPVIEKAVQGALREAQAEVRRDEGRDEGPSERRKK